MHGRRAARVSQDLSGCWRASTLAGQRCRYLPSSRSAKAQFECFHDDWRFSQIGVERLAAVFGNMIPGLFVFSRTKLAEFWVAQRVVKRAADKPAAFLFAGMNNLRDPCHNRATAKLDDDLGPRLQRASEE